MFRKTLLGVFVTGVLCAAVPLSARSWYEICDSGKLQVLTTDTARDKLPVAGLPRRVMPIDREQAILESFARQHHLRIEYVRGADFKTLFKLLDMGRGDLISANLAETLERKEKYRLSLPFATTREMLFTAKSSTIQGNSWNALAGHTAILLPGTTYVENFRNFARGKEGLTFSELDRTISHDELIEKVASGEIAYSALNESSLDAWLAYRGDIRKLFPLRGSVPLVFAGQRDAGELMEHLDAFIRELTMSSVNAAKANDFLADGRSVADLDRIRQRGYIRMLTDNDAFGCFLHRGQLMGFEYELAKRFGDGIHVRIATVMEPDINDLCQMLIDGRGDFIAANFALTEERIKKYPQLTFCAPYAGATPVVIGRNKEMISKPADLKGRRVYVIRGSNCHDLLLKIQRSGIAVEIVPLPPEIGVVVMLNNAGNGKYDLVATDDTYLPVVTAVGCPVKKLFALDKPVPFVCVVRKSNPLLAAEINAFFARERKSAFYNLCYRRYYGTQLLKKVKVFGQNRNLTMISPYDAIFRKYGMRYGFNWLFLAAQSYQESRFVPTRVNYIGAIGLMQVTPGTAHDLGISNLTDPDNGVHAGTKYMAKLRKHFEKPEISPEDRLCFTLAAYNAGYGHVLDARKLAAQRGLNPNVWFGNVEKTLALLEDPAYAARAKFGYCRASETIPYVGNIMHQARHYENLLQLQREKTDAMQKGAEKGEKKK